MAVNTQTCKHCHAQAFADIGCGTVCMQGLLRSCSRGACAANSATPQLYSVLPAGETFQATEKVNSVALPFITNCHSPGM